MGFKTSHQAIRGKFNAAWDSVAVPVAWSNVGNNGVSTWTPPTDRPYIRFYIVDAESNQRTIGDPAGKNVYRSLGVIVAQVYGLDNKGEDPTLDLADTIAAIFRNQRFGGVWSLTPKITNVGPVDPSRYQINVTIPFQRDEVL